MITGGVVILLVAGIGYVWISAPQQMDKVIIIKAEEAPYKVIPTNPGGAKIKNTDSVFLNSLDTDTQTVEGGEQLLPEDPVPELPPIDITGDISEQDVNLSLSDNLGNEIDGREVANNEDVVKIDELPKVDATNNVNDTKVEDIEVDNDLDVSETILNEQKSIIDQPVPVKITETPLEIEPETYAASDLSEDSVSADLSDNSVPSDSGVPIPKAGKNLSRPDETKSAFYRVQLAAFKNEGKAMQVAALLMNKHSSRLDQISIGVTLHDAGEQGIFWRVVTDPMPRANANKLCNTLKSVGQDCILRSWN